ncbi:MAG TPA: hypothetical protein VLD37_06180 [Candidatus Bilamarchaeum sp.]|nr:hypothetical protein [Candidatus Bilamarchaeum sp.]
MSKYKMVSYLFILLGVVVFAGSAYLVISYASDILRAVVEFVTTNDYTKLQQCGINPPAQFDKLKGEFATIILPSLYLGPIALFVVISAIMFLAGIYYQRGKVEDEARKHEEIERVMVHKIVNKMEREKPSQPSAVSRPAPTKRVVERQIKETEREVPADEETEEMEEVEETEEPAGEESDDEPPRKSVKRR